MVGFAVLGANPSRVWVLTRGGMMAVMAAADVEVDRPVAVRERLEAFGVGVLADAMNRPAQMVNGGFYEAPWMIVGDRGPRLFG